MVLPVYLFVTKLRFMTESNEMVNFTDELLSFFSPFTLNNDIALLQLASEIPFDDKAMAVCSPDPSEDYVGDTATVSGWGNINNVRRKYVLQSRMYSA